MSTGMPPRQLATWALVTVLGVSGCAASTSELPTDSAVVEPSEAPRAAAPSPVPAPVAAPTPETVPDGAQAAVVEHITDGDTISVRVDEPGGPLLAGASHTIRLLEMDTPETVHPAQGVECWGPQASAFTAAELAIGSTVYLVADEQDTDQYGRFLRYVWTADGTFFNEHAVREGHARAVLFEPNDAHIDALRAAEDEARAAGRGMWGPSCDHAAAAPAAEEEAAAGAAPAAGCEPGYDPCVPAFPPDLDCADVGGPLAVTGPDPHNLDGDRDGAACEG